MPCKSRSPGWKRQALPTRSFPALVPSSSGSGIGAELTIPEVVQTIILTRGEGQTPMPTQESLASLAAHQASLCLFLSARLSRKVQEQLLTAYPPETPVASIGVSWPDEKILLTELQHLHRTIREHKLTRTTLILGPGDWGTTQPFALHNHAHIFRRRSHEEDHPSA